jgi:hypothetical protein
MKIAQVIGAVVGAALVLLLVISLVKGRWIGRPPVPAAVGFTDGEEGGPSDGPHHLTHHPIVVSPRELPAGAVPSGLSPAAGDERRGPATDVSPAGRAADSFLPRTSFLPPIPDPSETPRDPGRPRDWSHWPGERTGEAPSPAANPGRLPIR